MSGILYVVATPIGNLGDFSPRACATLAEADVVAAEDTRRTRRLLQHFGIHTPLVSLHEHNERRRLPELIERLAQGASVALVSDAGTPLLSDPGFLLVRQARQCGVRVSPVPGPSALVAALSIAGLPTDRFAFEGFPPARPAARRRAFTALAEEPRTLVFYESSHRILESLADMAACFGAERQGLLARELTKRFEESRLDTLSGLRAWLQEEPQRVRGEFVVVVAGCTERSAEEAEQEAVDRTLEVLLRHLPVKQAAAIAAELTGEARNRLYARALELERKPH
ncbi:MAG: 16S rRNA (cytidine(1402)-2'-O)-methyltransferase [Gammaproteobacteria bacterium]|nr:MAG: 16S rRNA (cytidine(1402)-2'-O)-methyltransferase [Gammaproteobacteria bacterium]